MFIPCQNDWNDSKWPIRSKDNGDDILYFWRYPFQKLHIHQTLWTCKNISISEIHSVISIISVSMRQQPGKITTFCSVKTLIASPNESEIMVWHLSRICGSISWFILCKWKLLTLYWLTPNAQYQEWYERIRASQLSVNKNECTCIMRSQSHSFQFCNYMCKFNTKRSHIIMKK